MPLTMVQAGKVNKIKKITGKDESQRFLNNLGFIVGETVTVVSQFAGNMILTVKETRVALDKDMAKRIIV
ncbi:MAG: FeoA family protein [Anaerovoracaceae bacterium]